MLLTIRPIVDMGMGNCMPHLTIAVRIHDRTDWAVDWQLLPVDAQPSDLSVKVREVPPLQERVIAKADTWDNMTSAERHLFRLREELIDGPVKSHFADDLERHKLLRPNLCSVEDVEFEIMLPCLRNDLDTKLPLRIGSSVDSLFKVFSVEV